MKDTLLGKSGVTASKECDSAILYPIPREDDRKEIGIKDKFIGVDIWNAYEFTHLDKHGIPAARILQIRYTSDSKCIVESKSLKLYLNSYASWKGTTEEACKLISVDLRNLVGVPTREGRDTKENQPEDLIITAYTSEEYQMYVDNADDPRDSWGVGDEWDLDRIETSTDVYEHDPDLIEVQQTENKVIHSFSSSVLRSNCKVTHQPDFGDVVIHIEGDKIPTGEGLLKYIISFRNENHFHEEICERMMHDLIGKCNPDVLYIALNYTRRGGIDINPQRVYVREGYPLSQDITDTLTQDLDAYPWVKNPRQ